MASKSQQKRMAVMTGADKNPGQPAWKENQQKQTEAKDNDDREEESKGQSAKTVKVRLLTDYRDVAKKGDIAEFDEGKALQLVNLGRAEFVKAAKKSEGDDFETGRDVDNE